MTDRPGVVPSAPDADFSGWACPLPLRDHDRIVLGHGGGGRLTQELVEHLFLPAFRAGGADPDAGGDANPDAYGDAGDGADPGLRAGSGADVRAGARARRASDPVDPDALGDAAVIDVSRGVVGVDGGAPRPVGRLAVTTDSYVVRPLFFPGGSIGELAVHGTVNDLAMVGAVPVALTAGFVLEEGLPLAVLGRVVEAMGAAARAVGVPIAAGDTKVVEAGKADGLYITTAGVGVVPDGVDLAPRRARPGDAVVVSGPIGDHGVAVLSQRDGLSFGAPVESDSAPLHGLVAAMVAAARAAGGELHVLRDATRGGVAAVVNEIAASAQVGIELEESALPVRDVVAAACSFLGLDPLEIANEGRLVAFVPPGVLDAVLAAMQADPHGRDAVVIGTVVDAHPGVVVARTPYGAGRIVDVPLGEALPRIC